MRQYDSYRDSGVEWIGKIPSHWDIVRLKTYCSLKGRIGWNGLRSDEFKEKSYAYLVTGQDFNSSDIVWSKCYQIDKSRYDEDPFIQLSNGDLLITKDGTIGKVAKVANLDKPACLNSGIFVMKQKMPMFSQGYLYWLLCSDLLKGFNKFTSSGTTILHLYQNVFEKMPMTVPSMNEQEAIASYLDAQTARIDNVIQARESKIKLLEELRASIIYKAVTKGISNNAETKDSGIEWIGKIPKHWEAMKVAHVFETIGSGTTPKTTVDEYYSNEGINWLQTGELKDGHIKETSKKITQKALNELGLTIYPRGSVVVAMYGATIGKVGILDIDTTTNQACCVLNSKKYMIPDFAFFAFISAKESLISLSYGGGQPNISQEKIRSHKIPVPPIEEQKEITLYIKEKLLNIKNSIEQSQREIELLKEYRSSLISEVVTGKKKVVL